MNKLSVVVIVKNEEQMIADCIDSLSFCDEAIVIDNNSSDRTVEIAKRMGAKVFKSDSNDFSVLRNLGLKKASGNFILYVDADERVTPELCSAIKNILLQKNTFAGYKVLRKNFYFGYEWPAIEKMERLFIKKALKGWKGYLHESPLVEGKMGILEGFLLHYTHRDLSLMLDKTIAWSETEAKLRLKSNHPEMKLWRFPRVMAAAFFNSYIIQKGYKAGTMGIVESIYQAFSIFITYARLWELQQKL